MRNIIGNVQVVRFGIGKIEIHRRHYDSGPEKKWLAWIKIPDYVPGPIIGV